MTMWEHEDDKEDPPAGFAMAMMADLMCFCHILLRPPSKNKNENQINYPSSLLIFKKIRFILVLSGIFIFLKRIM